MNTGLVLRNLKIGGKLVQFAALRSYKSGKYNSWVEGKYPWHMRRHKAHGEAFINLTSPQIESAKQFGATVSMKPDVWGVSENGKYLQVEWPDGSTSRFHSIWLRHNCHSPKSKQPGSGQKIVDINNIRLDIIVEKVEVKGKDVEILYNDGHFGVIPLDFLVANDYGKESLARRAEKVRLTEECTAKSVPKMEFAELMESQENILRWMKTINIYGFCLLTAVPQEASTVVKVAELIDRSQPTIYGEMFDVVSTPTPINIAYSSVSLDLHMDLVYYESPPGLQILHALRYDDCVQGGESMFLDSFQVAEDFRKLYPDHFDTLARIPATFQKIHYEREKPVHMTYQRPHIVLNRRKEIVNINWSPSFEGALAVPENEVEEYYEAYHKFALAVKESPHLINTQLREGDLVVFNNRRILHGRHDFQLNGGVRHLRGCYVNIDHFKSKLQHLTNTIGDSQPVKRVGNQDEL